MNLVHRWRQSLQFRLVATVLAVTLLLTLLMGPLLIGRISSGLLASKEDSSIAEATAGRRDAQRFLDGVDVGADSTPARLVDNLASVLSARSEQSELFDVVLVASQNSGNPNRATNQVSPDSVPEALRNAVRDSQRQSWTYTLITYLDGRQKPGLVVGAPLYVPELGAYEVYHLFPMGREQETIDLVQSASFLIAAILVLGMSALAWLISRQVVRPVKRVAESAQLLSEGSLHERVKLEGEDELAQLGRSFNDMAESIEDKIIQLQEMSVMQQRFVSDVSHELRTPLTTIQMAAHVLHEGVERPDLVRSSELLVHQLDRFESLLADLLEISRFDAGAASLEEDQVDLVSLLSRVVDDMAPLADDSGSWITSLIPAQACVINCDGRRVDRILRNLISNALKYGQGKPVEVRLAEAESSVSVGVRDHGMGFLESERARVFDRFWRADPSRSRSSAGGTGLGLAIAAEDAALHGGRIDVWGAPGEGAHFVLTLPRVPGSSLGTVGLEAAPASAAQGDDEDPAGAEPVPEPAVPEPVPEPAVPESAVPESAVPESAPSGAGGKP